MTGPSLVGRLSMSNDSGAVDAPGVGGDAFGWELAVADQVVVNREFEQPVEDEASAPRPPSVEAENEFVEVALELRVIEASLVSPEVPAFGQRRDAVDPGQQRADILACSGGRSLAMRFVEVAEPIDALVAAPPVGHDRRSRFDVCHDEGMERVG